MKFFRALPYAILLLALVAPVLAVVGMGLQWDVQSNQIVREMAATVLPDYVSTTFMLCLGVGLGVALLGLITALTVAVWEFPGRHFFEWALLLPLAMPAYVVAYAYTDFFQYSGPAQNALRHAFNLQGRVLPEVRSVSGAIVVFTLCLYPYVYLLVRTAVSERSSALMDAARLLGAGRMRQLRAIVLPMARPAMAAGIALALMETLADFGVSSYFGIQTFSAGIYKAWLAMDNRIAAAQLSLLLLSLVAVVLHIERRAQARLRFANARGGASVAKPQRWVLARRHWVWAWLTCALPIALGFVLPVVTMAWPLVGSTVVIDGPRFASWAFNSLWLSVLTSGLALLIALVLAATLRHAGSSMLSRAVGLVARVAGLGYAIPGVVVVVGLLLVVGWGQAYAPSFNVGYWVTVTSIGLVWAYLVRFVAVALQAFESGYARIPLAFDESARMLGAGRWRVFRQIHAPLLRRSTVAAALLVFVDVMKELPVTLVLRPFDSDTLAVMTYQLARDERLAEASVPALALVLVGLLPVILLSRAQR